MVVTLKLDILGWPYREYIKTANGDDFVVTLAIFCSYGNGANASESVQEITTDEKGFYKYFVSVIVCLTTAYQ